MVIGHTMIEYRELDGAVLIVAIQEFRMKGLDTPVSSQRRDTWSSDGTDDNSRNKCIDLQCV